MIHRLSSIMKLCIIKRVFKGSIISAHTKMYTVVSSMLSVKAIAKDKKFLVYLVAFYTCPIKTVTMSIQFWTDCRLRWNKTEFGGVDKLMVSSERMWIPDITLYDRYSIHW